MKYYLDYTAHGNCRLWLTISMPDSRIELLNALSCWGGFDKQGTDYLSWEFDKELYPYLQRMANSSNWQVCLDCWE